MQNHSYFYATVALGQVYLKKTFVQCPARPQTCKQLVVGPVDRYYSSAVDSGGAWGARAPPEFGGSEKG